GQRGEEQRRRAFRLRQLGHDVVPRSDLRRAAPRTHHASVASRHPRPGCTAYADVWTSRYRPFSGGSRAGPAFSRLRNGRLSARKRTTVLEVLLRRSAGGRPSLCDVGLASYVWGVRATIHDATGPRWTRLALPALGASMALIGCLKTILLSP